MLTALLLLAKMANDVCSALEPKISGQIMEIHHSKHHATYVAGLNAAGKELEQVHIACVID